MSQPRLRRGLGVFLAVASAIASAGAAQPPKSAPRPPRLTAQERDQSMRIARDYLVQSPKMRSAFEAEERQPVYPTRVELLPSSSRPGATTRKVRVEFYRYADDTTVVTNVDLRTGDVVGEARELRHTPTPLHPDEVAEAKRLAGETPEIAAVRRQVGDALIADTLVNNPPTDDPDLGRCRVADVIYRVGPNYLALKVTVNLTKKTAKVVPSAGLADRGARGGR